MIGLRQMNENETGLGTTAENIDEMKTEKFCHCLKHCGELKL